MAVKSLHGIIDIVSLTMTAAGTIAAGTPIAYDDTAAAADSLIKGVARRDMVAGDVDSVIAFGVVDCVSDASAIVPGSYIKVVASNRFGLASAADLAAGKVVGVALTAGAGAGKLFSAFIGKTA